jgi:hypothetical protein
MLSKTKVVKVHEQNREMTDSKNMHFKQNGFRHYWKDGFKCRTGLSLIYKLTDPSCPPRLQERREPA